MPAIIFHLNFGNAGNQTRAGWAWSVYATSVSCRPLARGFYGCVGAY